MKKIILSFISLFFVFYSFSQEVLTNQSIIKLHELGFTSDIIKSKIDASRSNFNVSLDSLTYLKNKGIPSDVLAAMIEKSKKSVDTGIFYYSKDGKLDKISPSVFSGTKTSALASGLTYGIASAKIKSYIPGIQSKNAVNPNKEEFIFQFDPTASNTQNMGSGSWWFKAASSPNEFALTQLKVKRNKRELTTGKISGITASTQIGIDPKNLIKFKITDLGSGRYKVTPSIFLGAGEYCFFYQGTIPQGGINNQSIFDFSVH